MKAYNVVIVGGGSAGWLTALYVKQKQPNFVVTVVESPEIGILGAGEGTTPHFVSLLDELQIPLSDLIKETETTIKNGIKFTNWHGDGTHYYHPFHVDHIALGDFNQSDSLNEYLVAPSMAISSNITPTEYNLMTKLCESNKVPQTALSNAPVDAPNPIYNYSRLANFSVHFDASKLASFFKKVAIDRGVVHIEGTVTEITSDTNGDIKSLVLTSGQSLPTNFVFDCSGFNRLIIGKHFKSTWVSYKEFLPVDAAIPFFLKKEDEVSPYTESIAMKNGWMWRIPLQHRQGCGYVYDSSLMTEEEAVKEIEDFLGFEPEYPRKNKGGFKFSAGYYETPWVNNCVAIGLASGFIEPLEATSIFASIVSLKKVFNDVSWLSGNMKEHSDRFNKEMYDFTDSIFNFVYYHYLGKRNDSTFWKRFKDSNSHPKFVSNMLNTVNTFVLRRTDLPYYSAFGLASWLVVSHGLRKLDNKTYGRFITDNGYDKEYGSAYTVWRRNLERATFDAVSHDKFLKDLKS